MRIQADFIYHITPDTISITDTGMGKQSVVEKYRRSLAKDRALASGLDQLV
jgi:hypothetical protein